MDVYYQVKHRLQAAILARKCDISHWFPCGTDRRTGGQTDVRSRSYQFLWTHRETNFLSHGAPPCSRARLLLQVLTRGVNSPSLNFEPSDI